MEIRPKYRLFPSPKDHRDFVHAPLPSVLPLPPIVDLRSEMPPILNQGDLGSCSANATSNILRHLLRKESKPEFQPSRLYLYYNTRVNIEHVSAGNDSGACLRDVCIAVQNYHACDETTWPYDISKFSTAPSLESYKNADLHSKIQFCAVNQDINTIKKTLADRLPILIGIRVYASLESAASITTGHIPMPDVTKEQNLGGHALVLCGYNDETKRFLLMNSWGTGIGLNGSGYFDIPYEYLLQPELASDFWVFKSFE